MMRSKSHKFLHYKIVCTFLLLPVTQIEMISLARSPQRSQNCDIMYFWLLKWVH
jgi:hypothetical protein